MGNIKASFSAGGPTASILVGAVVRYFWDSEEGETQSSVLEMCRIASSQAGKPPKCPSIDNSV